MDIFLLTQTSWISIINNWLEYYEGFSVDDDFSLYVDTKWARLGTFLTTNDNEFSLTLIKVCDSYYCELSVKDSLLKQYVNIPNASHSHYHSTENVIIDLNSTSESSVTFEVKRKGGYYSLHVYEKE